MGNPLGFFWLLSILFILFLPNVSNNLYHGTGEYQLYAQHKGIMVSASLKKKLSDHKEA